MALYDIEEFVEFTKDYAKSFQRNTTLIEDYERTKYEHYLNFAHKDDEDKLDALNECCNLYENKEED